jgi:hypothetical protein
MTLAIEGKKPWKRNKFNAQRTTIDGIHFHSKKEGLRWLLLRQRERGGEIRNLQRQVPFQLVVNGFLICTYIADFTYDERDPKRDVLIASGVWQPIVDDAKGVETPEFKLKAKLFEAIFGRKIRLT